MTERSAMTPSGEIRPRVADAREVHERLELPPGWKSEIIDGLIQVSRGPGPSEARIIMRLAKALWPAEESADWEVLSEVEIEHPEFDGLYSPDLLVTPVPNPVADKTGRVLRADRMLLVAEVTSPSNARDDRGPKLEGYARARVPLYLLVDRQNRTVQLFSDPDKGEYAAETRVPFGASIALPAPFEVTIRTDRFDEDLPRGGAPSGRDARSVLSPGTALSATPPSSPPYPDVSGCCQAPTRSVPTPP
jgi:Uma2 family endonuclease